MPRLRAFAPLAALAFFTVANGCVDSDPSPAAADAGVVDGANGVDTGVSSGGGAYVEIGIGSRPGLAVDSAGTAYIAWLGPENEKTTIHVCRLPRGAPACAIQTTIVGLGTSLTRPFVTANGSRVTIAAHFYGLTGDTFEGVFAYTSTDAGASFDAGRQVGTVAFDDAVNGPGATVSLATHANTLGTIFENVPLEGAVPLPVVRGPILSADHPYSGCVGLVDAATPVVAFADLASNAQFRRYDGSGSLNDVTNWSAPQAIGQGDYMHLAGGPTGLFMKNRAANNSLEVRKFDGNTFAAGVAIPEGTGELPQSHIAQDAAGRLHLVWPRIDADGIRLYRAISDDGQTWRVRLLRTDAVNIASMRVAAAPDHIGLTVWQADAGIRAMAIGPDA